MAPLAAGADQRAAGQTVTKQRDVRAPVTAVKPLALITHTGRALSGSRQARHSWSD